MNIGILLNDEFGPARARFASTMVRHLQASGHRLFLIGNDPVGVMPDTLDTVNPAVDFNKLLAVSDEITARQYHLSHHEEDSAIFVYTGSALPQPLHLALAVTPYQKVAHLPPLPKATLIPYPKPHRDYGSGADLPKSQYGLVWFTEMLEEYLLTSTEMPEHFLSELTWQDELRLRKERFGGILFVPETSQLVLLNEETYQRVEQAIDNNETTSLLTGSRQDIRWIASMLTAQALVRRQPAQQA